MGFHFCLLNHANLRVVYFFGIFSLLILTQKQMELSNVIAQILGVIYVVVGLGFLLNQDYYRKAIKQIVSGAAVPYFGGVAALTVGYLITYYHNIWEKDWVTLITVVGWLALLKGFIYLMAPDFGIKLANNMLKKSNPGVWGIFIFALGLVFVYFGFFG